VIGARLERRLGAGIVIQDPRALDEAATDLWPLNLIRRRRGDRPSSPAALVLPRSEDDVVAALVECAEAGVPVVPAGTFTGVTGGANAIEGAVTLSLRAMDRVLDLDAVSGQVTIEPGILGLRLEEWLNERDLTLGHFPTSVAVSSLGGFLACRSAGQASTLYGKAEDFTAGLRVVLADGSILDTGSSPRAATGPSLTHLFLGSEGTLGVITRATLRVWRRPLALRCAAFLFADTGRGLDAMRSMLQDWARPAIVRLYDELDSVLGLQSLGLELPRGSVMLLVSEGPQWLVQAQSRRLEEIALEGGARGLGDEPARAWLRHRYDLDAERLRHLLAPPGSVVETIEVAAPWASLADIHREAVAPRGDGILMAHFSHAYPDGAAIYFTFAGSAAREGEAEKMYQRAWDRVLEPTLKHGGVISHHHGVGLVRAGWMERANPGAHAVLRRLKSALDPASLLNPGKLGL
jgi:alkyldihydroxyacetonephosphate synthase